MKYIRGIYRNEFLLSLVLGLIATWILGGSAHGSTTMEKRVNVKTRAMIERIEAEKREKCVSIVQAAVTSEDVPAAVEACESKEGRALVKACGADLECVRYETVDQE